MHARYLLTLALIIISSCRTELPEQKWYKGNLHTHSLWSDGDDFPEMIIQWYKDHDYQFIAMSDHNTIAEGEFWYKLKEREIKNKTLEKYQQAFGDWVEIKDSPDSTAVRLKTFEEYRSKLEEPGIFKIIRSEEVSASYQKKPVHINVTNIQHMIEPQQGSSVVDVMQQTLDLVKKQRNETNVPMFAHINHPNFGFGISADDIKKLNGEQFFEVYNGHPAVFNNGNGSHISTEEMWDAINISYYQQGKPLLYGIATDDSHNYHEQSSVLSNTGRGWIMVGSDGIATNALIDAMETGNFYASTGISLKTVFHNKKYYIVEIIPEDDIRYEVIFYVYKKGAESVIEFSRLKGTTAKYTFEDDDIFVRAKIISDKEMSNPIKEGETMKAWTQPVLIQQN